MPKMTTNYLRPYLQQLEAEAIFVLREVAAQFERPMLLFSGGKDSILLVHLVRMLVTLVACYKLAHLMATGLIDT